MTQQELEAICPLIASLGFSAEVVNNQIDNMPPAVPPVPVVPVTASQAQALWQIRQNGNTAIRDAGGIYVVALQIGITEQQCRQLLREIDRAIKKRLSETTPDPEAE